MERSSWAQPVLAMCRVKTLQRLQMYSHWESSIDRLTLSLIDLFVFRSNVNAMLLVHVLFKLLDQQMSLEVFK